MLIDAVLLFLFISDILVVDLLHLGVIELIFVDILLANLIRHWLRIDFGVVCLNFLDFLHLSKFFMF